MKRAIAAVLIVSSLASSGTVQSQGDWQLSNRFLSPSGNIYCQIWNSSGILMCEVRESSAQPPPGRPTDCPVDWGKHFYIEPRGNAIRLCYGENIQFGTVPVLPYGKVRQVGGVRCDVTTARMRCVNLDKHGFELSRARQILF